MAEALLKYSLWRREKITGIRKKTGSKSTYEFTFYRLPAAAFPFWHSGTKIQRVDSQQFASICVDSKELFLNFNTQDKKEYIRLTAAAPLLCEVETQSKPHRLPMYPCVLRRCYAEQHCANSQHLHLYCDIHTNGILDESALSLLMTPIYFNRRVK